MKEVSDLGDKIQTYESVGFVGKVFVEKSNSNH